jgi:hypothetical protein
MLLMPSLLAAQDLIIKNDGEKILCKISKEDSINLYFRINWNDHPLNTFIKRDEVKSYSYDYNKWKQELRDSIKINQKYSSCATFGYLQGGGSLVGYDVELLLGDKFGFQLGVGFIGFGAGINYHFKPDIRSSFISLQYWHQGIENYFIQSLIGPCFVFREKKLFTAQIGLGFALEKGPAWPSSKTQPPVMLTYSIGFYLPG